MTEYEKKTKNEIRINRLDWKRILDYKNWKY